MATKTAWPTNSNTRIVQESTVGNMPQVVPPAPEPMPSLSQHQKIIAKICCHTNKEWWLPTDFMDSDEFFVGYEASARLSELQRQYPAMFETRPAGKYKERRIRFETGKEWYADIPKDLQLMVKQYYRGAK